MNKEFTIKLSNPYNKETSVSLFGVSDFNALSSDTENKTFLSLTGYSGSSVGGNSVGQSWTQPGNGNVNKITVMWSAPEYRGVQPEGTATLTIYEGEGTSGNVLATYPNIVIPEINPAGALIAQSYDVDIDVETDKKYSYVFSGFSNSYITLVESATVYDEGSPIHEDIVVPLHADFYSIISGIGYSSINNIEAVNNQDYIALLQSLKMNPQPYNCIKILSDSITQRLKVIDIINRNILGYQTDTEPLNAATYMSNKDFGNMTEIMLKEPILLGEKELNYILEPNTNVTIVFSHKKNEKKETLIKHSQVKRPILDSEIVKKFIKAENIEKIKIITLTVGTVSLLVFLLRKIIL